MRPIKLTVQGLASYRDRMEVDFADLDLFAITGPTGAGKSSLVDAITYALYGQVPRVGKNIKELINQGTDRLKVELEFSVGETRYRIHRSTARRGATPVQIERFDSDAGIWQPEEPDRVREVNKFIEVLLCMDYEAFIRSVLLPQGQFQEFLAGDPAQRRKVLDGLLQLGIYGVMQQRANGIAIRQSEDADRIRDRLDTELSHATPETLDAAKSDLERLKVQAEEEAAIRQALESASHLADTLTDARTRQRETREALTRAEEALADAQKLLGTGEQTLAALDDGITELRRGMAEAAYDSDAHIRLSQCLPLLREMERTAGRETKLGEDITHASAAVSRQLEEERSAKAVLEAARRAAEEAQAAYDRAREGNAAALLQSSLKPGDTCPVCGASVGRIQKHEVAQLDKVRSVAESRKVAERDADAKVHEIGNALTKSRQALEGYEKQLADARADYARRSAEIDNLIPEAGLSLVDVQSRLAALDAAKERIEALSRDEKSLIEERELEAASIAAAQKTVTEHQAELKTRTREVETAIEQAATAEHAIKALALESRWDDVLAAIDRSDELTTLVRQHLQVAQQHEGEAREQIGACQTRIEVIEANIETADRLRGEEKEHREAASLAKDLASLLRADRFPAFIRDEAMNTLSVGGSEWLQKISEGRYDLVVEGQDFEVADQWNAGSRRSVKTLSGGETFMASLSLALALAEQLPALAGEGGASALESLFIDEGFSNLDTETLDDVASSLEVLGQDRRRLIGVITHLPALAERMPARITVHKSQSGSTVTVD